MKLLDVIHLKKVYSSHLSHTQVEALSDVNFSIEKGEYAAVMGESGSGKTTLLNLIASLDRPTSGQIFLDGHDLALVKERNLAAYRRENLGFVFQDFNLLDTFSIQDNIFLPLVLSGKKKSEMTERLLPLAKLLGISDILKKYPYEVSGGQKQRAAAARALIINPKLLLADEPTGALDSRATENLLHIFEKINQTGQTILMVTHSIRAASHAGRVLFMKDGTVYHQLYKGLRSNEMMYQEISNTLTLLSKGGPHE